MEQELVRLMVECVTEGSTAGTDSLMHRRVAVMRLPAPLTSAQQIAIVAAAAQREQVFDPEADTGFWRAWYFGFIPWQRETVTPASLRGEPVPGAEERERLWPKAVATYSGYAGYQERTARKIPLVILEPRSGSASG